MTVQKIKSGRVPGLEADNFVGDNGVLFFNESVGDLRLGDGITPGGIPLVVGGGGGYVLPTASTTVKGGVKIDGTTITIANQIISVGTVPYSSVSGKPTLAIVATSGSYTDLTDKPTIPTNNNQLTNGAGYITSSALTGYATETYVTTRGYLTAVSWSDVTGKPTFATVATSGSYTDLTNRPSLFSGSYNDLTNKPTIPSDISQLTDTQGLLGQGGGGGGTTYITNNVENPYTFSVAGDDSTLREISNGETLRFAGATGISITTDAEGKVTITGPDLSSYATQSYVTGQGYITSSALTSYATETYVTTRGYLTSVDWSIITSKPSFSTVATSGSYTDLTNTPTLFSGSYTDLTNKPTLFSGSYNDLTDKPTIPTNNNQLTNGAGYITTAALTGYATETFVTTRGYLTSVSWNEVTDKPSLAGTYSFSVAADDSSLKEILSGESIKFSGAGGITTSSDAEGNITITGPDLSSYATQSYVTGQGYITSSALTGLATETFVTSQGYITGLSWNELTDKPNLAGTYSWSIAADDSTQVEISSGNLVKIVGSRGVTTTSNADGQITITGPDLSSYATQSYVTSALNSAGVTISETAPTGRLNGALWYNSTDLQMYVLYQNQWITISAGFTGNYNDLQNKPTNISQFTNDRDFVTRDEVYAMILEVGQAGI